MHGSSNMERLLTLGERNPAHQGDPQAEGDHGMNSSHHFSDVRSSRTAQWSLHVIAFAAPPRDSHGVLVPAGWKPARASEKRNSSQSPGSGDIGRLMIGAKLQLSARAQLRTPRASNGAAIRGVPPQVGLPPVRV